MSSRQAEDHPIRSVTGLRNPASELVKEPLDGHGLIDAWPNRRSNLSMSTPSDRNRPPAQQPPLFEVADDRPSLAPPPNPEPTGRPRLRVANRDRIVFRAAPRGALIPQAHPARVIGDDVDGLDLKPLYDRIKAV